MQKKTPSVPPTAAELRRRAEERLRKQPPETGQARTGADIQRLVHELQVHQVELEMQNEELKWARDEMEAGLEKYSDLYDFAPVGFLTLDREGTILEANLTCANLLGIERARLVNRPLGFCLSPPDLPPFNAFLTRVFEGKARQSCEVTLLKEGKPTVAVRIEAAAASGQECRAVLDDITEQKRAEEDRLMLNRLESTGILAAGIAHDFNNLLTMILLNLELAQTLSPGGEELAHHLEQAKQACLLAKGLTQQLVAFAAGGAPVRKPTLLPGLIEASVRLAASGSRLRCDFSLAEDLWPAEVDAGQIGQVIRNLVLNAREAKPAGGVISVRAENVVLESQEHPTLPPGEYIRVSVTDWGGGISKEVLPKIFDPYFSTKQRGTQKGMGLGLSICHTIIQKHGGTIAVESKPGVGSTFHILFPASRKLPQKDQAYVPAGVLGQRKILVMDDEEIVRKLVRRLLQQMGHEVELVEDGQRAVGAYESAKGQGRPFDAVILDLTIRDGVGGLETIRELLKIDPAVKAIVMSGYSNDPAVLEPERHGFKGVLTKPFDRHSLRTVLTWVLEPASSGPGPESPSPEKVDTLSWV
jgi:two-component system, cell cycle sensor histidine kinase and response regulator CckA